MDTVSIMAGARPSSRIGYGAAALLAAWALACAGCGLEPPEAPSFETTIYLPIEAETYTGQQMVAGLQAVVGDTASPGPLAVEFSREIEPVGLAGEIRVGIDERVCTADLAAIPFTPPELPEAAFGLAALVPAGARPPGGSGPVPAFTIDPAGADLGVIDAFEEAAFTTGRIDLVVRNDLPVPVGGAQADQALRVRLVDAAALPGTVAPEMVFAGEIAPGAVAQGSLDLAGRALSNALSIEISGGSPGSGGAPVDLGTTATLSVAPVFREVELGRLVGRLPALRAETWEQVEFSGGSALTEAVVSSGRLACLLESHWPVAATLVLEAPQIVTAGAPLRVETHVGPLGSAWVDLDLAGSEWVRGSAAEWRLHLTARTDATDETAEVARGSAVTATWQAGELNLASVRGVLDHVAVNLSPLSTAIEFPAGTEGVEFPVAEAEILVRNRAGLVAEATLELWAAARGDTVRVPVAAVLAAGSLSAPAETRITLDETNSAIVALLALRPDTLALSGTLAIGDGLSEGTVGAEDFVDGRLSLRAPMRLVLETAQQRGAPFEIDLDDDLRDRVADGLLALTVDAQVENHFPVAVSVEFHFAREEGALFVADDLILAAETIAGAQVDPATGRVLAAVSTPVSLAVAAGDIDLFTEGPLHGGLAITLLGDGENPIEIWSTDYVRVRGVAAFRCRID